jgi:Arc/MetJ-type ribon-helix-helix transcriptional regulator
MAKLDKRLKYQNDDEKPVTISMRLPKELHTKLEQYATQHRQSISELVRDGLELRLSECDPRGLGDASTQDDEAYYMSNTANTLADIRQALARQEAQIQAIVQALEPQATRESNGLVASHADTAPTTQEGTQVATDTTASPVALVPRVKADKATVIARLWEMHEAGLDSTQIAKAFQEEELPTLSGKGEWQSGTVRKLLKAATR